MKAQTVHCSTCGGAVDVDPSTPRHTCPYCGADVWAAAANTETGAAAARLTRAMQTYAAPVRQAQEAIMRAVAQRDGHALRAAVEEASVWTFRAYDEARFWKTVGAHDEAQIAEYKRNHIESQLTVWTRQAGLSAAPQQSDDERAAFDAYQAAFERRDLAKGADAFTRYMTLVLDRTPGWEQSSPEEKQTAVRSSLESVVRALPWVTKSHLEALGFDTLDDVGGGGGVIRVSCQNCGAEVEAEEGSEQVRCPYCEAVTKIQLYGAQQQEAFSAGLHAQFAQPGGHSASLAQARDAVRQSYPDVDPDSPRGRALAYFLLEQGFGWSLAPADFDAARAELGLGDETTCGMCATAFRRAEGLRACPVCQSPG